MLPTITKLISDLKIKRCFSYFRRFDHIQALYEALSPLNKFMRLSALCGDREKLQELNNFIVDNGYYETFNLILADPSAFVQYYEVRYDFAIIENDDRFTNHCIKCMLEKGFVKNMIVISRTIENSIILRNSVVELKIFDICPVGKFLFIRKR